MKRVTFHAAALAAVALAWACGDGTGPAELTAPTGAAFSAADPVIHDGNPNCVDLGYTYGYKLDRAPDGSETFDLSSAELVRIGGAPDLQGYTVTLSSDDGVYFDWSADLAFDAVIVKGGANAHVYRYEPPSTGDQGLHAPPNPNNDDIPYDISHIELCVNPAVMVGKTATASYTRTHEWSLDKTGSVSELTVNPGTQASVSYTITASHTGYTDSDHAVSGTITIRNPWPMDAVIAEVADVFDGLDGAVGMSCEDGAGEEVVVGGHVLGPGGSLSCAYTGASDGSDGTNLATVTAESTSEVGGGTATADFAFGDPTTEVDACIDVHDYFGTDASEAVALGTACAADVGAQATFEESWIGTFDVAQCGTVQLLNTAYAEVSGGTIEDSWTVDVIVPCETGCTLTQGYWKTHSSYGPAPEDQTGAWTAALIGLDPDGPDTGFYQAGMSWYDLLWTAPKGGNPYIQLAHQFMAARLNMAAGADVSAVATELDEAETLFLTTSLSDLDGLKGKDLKEYRETFGELAATLDAYNNGEIGPGHCDNGLTYDD